MTSLNEGDCPNCGTSRTGPYCAQCGQEQREARVSVGAWIKALLQEQLSLDGRFLRTSLALVFRPGFLTLEWGTGRQVRYTTPLRLYIVASIVFFGVTFFLGLPFNDFEMDLGELSTDIATSPMALANAVVERRMQTFLTLGAAISVPLLALLLRVWPRPGVYYVDHLVFSLHFHSFVLVNLTVAYALLFLGLYGRIAAGLLAVGVIVYWFVAWRKVYRPDGGRLRSLAQAAFDTGAWGLLIFGYVSIQGSLLLRMTDAPLNVVQLERGTAFYLVAGIAYREGDTIKARYMGDEAMQLLGQVDEDFRPANYDFRWAQLHAFTGDPEAAAQLARQLQVTTTSEELLKLGLIGSVAAQTGDTATARDYFTRLLARVDSGAESATHPANFAWYVEGARRFLGREDQSDR